MGILSGQKNELITIKDEVGAASSVLKFNYKSFAWKHVAAITLLNVSTIDKSSLNINKYILDFSPLPGLVKSQILKALIHEPNPWKEIISISTARKSVF